MTIWFISDTHFGHANIITYAARPFTCVEEMDEAMIERWNRVVKPSDHIYHLGDVSMSLTCMDAVMPRLQGHKRLVRGNHDIFKTARYLRHFKEIHGVRVLDNLIFTHIPIHPGSLGRFKGNVHGHLHANPAPIGPYHNICVEHTDYQPISLEQLSAQAKTFNLVKHP